jgi:vitellogenic carboxypeptidase-like protein/serine carboxypeptidase-like clade 4
MLKSMHRLYVLSMHMQVHNAGHKVPMDQPKASLEMLRRFTQGKLKESVPDSVLKAVM